ncbi:MAG: hypothetical protein JXA42_25760, partial [Anaerolineales bacterium]|nr:hypothetical protein [Anaerolineales bacterium]
MTQKKSTTRQRSSPGKQPGGRIKTTKGTPRNPLSRHQWAIIIGIVLIALSGVAILSGLGISTGKLTDWMWNGIRGVFGYGGYLAPITTGFVGLYLVLWGMEQPP